MNNKQIDPSRPSDELQQHLPESLKIMLSLTDMQTVFKLVSNYGGIGVHFPVPSHVRPDDTLAQLIGVDALMKLAQYFQGDTIYFPKATHYLNALRDSMILEDSKTMTNADLARKHGMSDRWIRFIKSRGIAKPSFKDERQQVLFE